ncbi:MAG TPA: hypothetical protein VJV78_35655 [Polyangiales bacterium]|nr:hypothetical protein [Polyangiales bacterium]
MWRAGLLLCLSLCACGFGHEVEQDGSYAIVPGTRVDDSALIPLKALLIIEQDLRIGQTRLYYFTGDLHGADLGLEDLRRIAARHGGYRMAFDPQRKFIEADEIESHGKSLLAHAGEDEIELVKLNNDGLRDSDAQRYLTSVKSNDYDVAAYFGVIDREGPLPDLSIDPTDVVYDPHIPSPELGIKTENEQLALDYKVNADYLVVELTQPIESHVDKRELDALVRTSLMPGSPYVVSPSLMTDVAGQGCWSRELPLELRLHQVVRHYDIDHAFAVIHDRIDVHVLAPDTWTGMLAKPQPPAYCKEFQ